MNHKEYYELLKDLKYSGWILLIQTILAIGFLIFVVTSLDNNHETVDKNNKINKTIKNE
jgi:hypothetical protein